MFKDDEGRIPVHAVDVVASDCRKYFNPME
jgi:hypothetical protein